MRIPTKNLLSLTLAFENRIFAIVIIKYIQLDYT